MSVGIGLSINNTRAVFEALFNKESEFTRTPNYRIEAAATIAGKSHRQSVLCSRWSSSRSVCISRRQVLRAGEPDLRHRPVPGALPGRLPLHRSAC
jgi:hypothetical protein